MIFIWRSPFHRTASDGRGAIVKSGVQALNQAAAWLMFVTSIPSLNFTPVITLAR
jgi:hypothetical protein